MIFKVSEKCKGSISLMSIKKVFTAGMTVSIDESKLLYNDIKMAIRSGILIPADEKEYKKKYGQQNSTVLVRNKSKKTVVLGEIVIKPLSIVAVDRNIVKEELFFNAQESGLIELVSKDGKVIVQTPPPVINTRPEVKRVGDMEDDLEEVKIEDVDVSDVEIQEIVSSPLAEENPVTPTVWDFRTQQSVEAEKVQKTECVDKVDNEEDEEEEETIEPEITPEPIKEETMIEDIFEEPIVEKIEEKIIETPVVIKKETRGRKKKENTVKKQNNIKPVGEQRIEKTSIDAEQDLDSRGQPVKNASDFLTKMINNLSKDEEVEMFVDKQQELDRLKKRLENND